MAFKLGFAGESLKIYVIMNLWLVRRYDGRSPGHRSGRVGTLPEVAGPHWSVFTSVPPKGDSVFPPRRPAARSQSSSVDRTPRLSTLEDVADHVRKYKQLADAPGPGARRGPPSSPWTRSRHLAILIKHMAGN